MAKLNYIASETILEGSRKYGGDQTDLWWGHRTLARCLLKQRTSQLAAHEISTADTLPIPDPEPTFVGSADVQSSNTTPADVRTLSLLLHALNCSAIPILLFERGRRVQSRWMVTGCRAALTPQEVGIDQHLLEVLLSTERFDAALKELRPLALATTINGKGVLSISSQLHATSSALFTDFQIRSKWTTEALRFVSFVFPREPIWEPRYVATGKALQPLLQAALEQSEGMNVPACVKNSATEALMAAPNIGSAVTRQKTLAMATPLIDDKAPDYLLAEAAHQQSVVSRLVADFDGSERYIQEFYRRAGISDLSELEMPAQNEPVESLNRRLYALCGRLHVSHLGNLVQTGRYEVALREVKSWKMPENPSLMEIRVLPSKNLLISKIFRAQGRFVDAQCVLQQCPLLPNDTYRYQVISGRADAYNDLDQSEEAHTDIQTARYEEARRSVHQLAIMFRGLHNLDVSDQLLHVRMLVASARLYHCNAEFRQAIEGWKRVLVHVQRYATFHLGGYTHAISNLSLSLAHLHVMEIDDAREAFECAKGILSRTPQDYWIPTLAKWVDFVASDIERRVGWRWST
ncbi:hypothetical protein LTR02_015407 [Friedmanniomyces endolithicus]|nr:hypothetical protein LTR02_015407 [Friedmanniomyces endolithicus]